MKIYSFQNKNGQAYLYTPDRAIAHRCIVEEPPFSRSANWLTPTFELVGCDELRSYLPKTDFPTLTIGTAVLSARAVDRLRPILDTCGEILPIRLSNDRDLLYLFNVTRIINAVDMERSTFFRFPSGSIAYSERLVFDPTLIPSQAVLFKTTQIGAADTIFANQLALDAVKRAHLTGYEFELAWTSD